MLTAKNISQQDLENKTVSEKAISDTELIEMLKKEVTDKEQEGIEKDQVELSALLKEMNTQGAEVSNDVKEKIAEKKELLAAKIQNEIGYEFVVSSGADGKETVLIKDLDNNQGWTYAPSNLTKEQLQAIGQSIDSLFEDTYFADTDQNFDIKLMKEDITQEAEQVSKDIVETEKASSKTNEKQVEQVNPAAEVAEVTKKETAFDAVLTGFEKLSDGIHESSASLENLTNEETPEHMKKNLNKAQKVLRIMKNTGKEIVTAIVGYLPLIAGLFGASEAQLSKMYGILKNKRGIDLMGGKVQYAGGKEAYKQAIEGLTTTTTTPQHLLQGLIPQDFEKNKTAYLSKLKITPLGGNQKILDNLMKKKQPSYADAEAFMHTTKSLSQQVAATTGKPAWTIQLDYLLQYKYSKNSIFRKTRSPAVQLTGNTWKGPFKEINGAKYITYGKHGDELSWYQTGKTLPLHDTANFNEYLTKQYPGLDFEPEQLQELMTLTGQSSELEPMNQPVA